MNLNDITIKDVKSINIVFETDIAGTVQMSVVPTHGKDVNVESETETHYAYNSLGSSVTYEEKLIGIPPFKYNFLEFKSLSNKDADYNKIANAIFLAMCDMNAGNDVYDYLANVEANVDCEDVDLNPTKVWEVAKRLRAKLKEYEDE